MADEKPVTTPVTPAGTTITGSGPEPTPEPAFPKVNSPLADLAKKFFGKDTRANEPASGPYEHNSPAKPL